MSRHVKRVVVTVVGALVTAAGVALMPLPGPGLLVVVAGLAILATEYVWARRLLEQTRDRARQAQHEAIASTLRTVLTVLFALGLVGLGVAAIAVPAMPFVGALSGSMLALGGVVLLTTTLLTYRSVRGRPAVAGAWPRRAALRVVRWARQAQHRVVATALGTVLTVLVGAGVVALGAAAVAVPEMPVLGTFTGSVLVLLGVVVLTTTFLSYRSVRARDGG